MGLRSGQVAKASGVSTDTLRHYEKLGLLPKPRRTPSGYRDFAPEAIARVVLIRRSLDLGFSLEEVGRILKLRETGGVPCGKARVMLEQKLIEIDCKIAELTAAKRDLSDVLREWDVRLAETPEGARAYLLESLAARPAIVRIERGMKK